MSVALATMESAYSLRLGLGGHHHHHHHPLHHHRHARLHLLHHHNHPASFIEHQSKLSSQAVGSPEAHHRQQQQQEMICRDDNDDDRSSNLGFSVVNILRPDFGRDAILSTRTSSVKRRSQSPICLTGIKIPRHSPLPVARDLSIASGTGRLSSSPQSPASLMSSGYSTMGHDNSRMDRSSFSSGESTSPLLPRLNSSGLSRSGSLESLASNRSSVTGCTGAPSLSSAASTIGSGESVSGESVASNSSTTTAGSGNNGNWPAWVFCTRYSDRPSSGPRTRRVKRTSTSEKPTSPDEKRPRTAFSGEQLARLKTEFAENRYLTERRRQQLSRDLGLNEAQIKIWFQNKRAKIKKASGQKNPLALQLMAQGLYNHSTVPVDEDGEEIPEGQSTM